MSNKCTEKGKTCIVFFFAKLVVRFWTGSYRQVHTTGHWLSGSQVLDRTRNTDIWLSLCSECFDNLCKLNMF
jgi:hypothetical protein